MYVLIPRAKLRETGKPVFRTTMPDGRAIVHISDMKSIGTVTGVDIIATQREVKELIAQQKEQGITPDLVKPTPEEDAPVDRPTILPELDADLLPPKTNPESPGSAQTEGTDGTTATDKEQTESEKTPTAEDNAAELAKKGGKQ